MSSADLRKKFGVILGALALGVSAHAAAAPPSRLGLCAACHGQHGIAAAPAMPNLAGQNLDYLRAAMRQYRSGARDVAAMRAASEMLTPAQLEDVLVWYSQQRVPGPAP